MKNTNEFAQFIEELRISRNIQREDFVDGIVSLRQYYRFIKGESSLKSESINALLEKLEISSIYAYENFRNGMDNNYSELKAIYDEFYRKNYIKGDELLTRIDITEIKTSHNRKLYEFLIIKSNYYGNRINKESAVQQMLLLIDYPLILEKEALSFIELSGILFVQDYLIRKGDYRITSHTYNILNNTDKTRAFGDKNQLLPFLISTIKSLGVIGKFEESLAMSEKLIYEFEVSNALDVYASSFYFKALNESNLYKDDRYKDTLTDLFCLLKSQKNKKYGDQLKELISRKFNIIESDVIQFKINKK